MESAEEAKLVVMEAEIAGVIEIEDVAAVHICKEQVGGGELDSRAATSLRARGENLSSRRIPSRPSSTTSSSATVIPSHRPSFRWLASFTVLSFTLAALLYWVAPSSIHLFSPNLQPQFKPGLNEVTYGSVVKLMHDRTQYRLHSHEIPYGSGSGQQSVTGFGGVDDANSYWKTSDF
ncbi:hypothetical protein L7F22_057567 [Adiantum nelumboides]|nr:hypothetical protein [Adiantum nelumboides]